MTAMKVDYWMTEWCEYETVPVSLPPLLVSLPMIASLMNKPCIKHTTHKILMVSCKNSMYNVHTIISIL